MSRRFYIVRHGETPGNLNGTFAGTLEYSLTEKGIEQSKELGSKLTGLEFDRIIVSPQIRAGETAEVALKAAGLDIPMIVEEEIRERNYADLQGLDKQKIKAEHGPLTPEVLRQFGAETDAEMDVRVVPAVLKHLEQRGTPMFIAHSGTTKALCRGLLGHGRVTRPVNCAVWLFEELPNGRWQASIEGAPYSEPAAD